MKKLLAATVALAALAACNQQAAETDAAPAVQLYAMDCGRISFTDTTAFADDGSFDGVARDFVDPCYLIRHPDGDLIWDTGFPDALNGAPDGIIIPGLNARATMPVTLASQLAQLNLTPADIEFVSFSHGHGDHTGNGNLFAGSTWLVDPDERAYMFRDEARADAQAFGAYNQLENAQARLIESDDFDVFGDGSVKIFQAPGHTPGHTVLLVNLPNAGAVLLTGDMYHMAESRDRQTVPRFNTDRAQTLASMERVEELGHAANARVIRQHVQEDFDSLPRFPEALN